MKPGLALFDFDGTITKHDTAKYFYKSLYKNQFVFLFRHLILCFPEILFYRLGFCDYLPLKRKRLQIHVGRLSDVEFRRYVSDFETTILPSLIKGSALDRVNWHKAMYHDIWIVSASYDFLLSNWCEHLGLKILVNRTIKNKGNIFVIEEDCNYDVKVKQINKNIQLSDYSLIYAYGDSDGDKAMLSLAHKPHFNFFI